MLKYSYDKVINLARYHVNLDDNQDTVLEFWVQADGRMLFTEEGERDELYDLAVLLAKIKYNENYPYNLDIDVAECNFDVCDRADMIDWYVESPYKKEHFNFAISKQDVEDIQRSRTYTYTKPRYIEFLKELYQEDVVDGIDDNLDWLESEIEWARGLSNDTIILSGYDDGKELEFI